MNKTGNIHTKEYYTAVKKNKEELYEQTWNDFQYVFLSEKKTKKSTHHKPPCV